jgi:hypothetical protein
VFIGKWQWFLVVNSAVLGGFGSKFFLGGARLCHSQVVFFFFFFLTSFFLFKIKQFVNERVVSCLFWGA